MDDRPDVWMGWDAPTPKVHLRSLLAPADAPRAYCGADLARGIRWPRWTDLRAFATCEDCRKSWPNQEIKE